MEAARRVAADVLAPTAQVTDRADVVPRSHLEALADAGLNRLYCPPGLAVAATREVFEVLAGACGVTFFVWVQHHAPVRMLARSANEGLRERYLDDLCSGGVLGGVAFAYLRRPGRPAVVARRVAGGYVVTGEAPWVTSWGLAGVFSVAARLGDQVVYFLVDPSAPALRPSPPLALAAMQASSTVRLAVDELFVPDDDVLSVMPFADWEAADRTATAQPNPAAFGVAATCVRLLAEHDEDAARALGADVDACRSRSYALADLGRTDDPHLAALVDARGRSLELAVRCATALVVSVGGRAMASDHPAQRLLREAAFFTIQAQTTAQRRATLAQLTSRSPGRLARRP
ncbi:MAG: acyl-CoA/acyl-ACP dehydrogenase [Actinomycetota bacterium]|nr:acyl-CoA/acyl-ACP dehydrogenase [Actinomycetota bacterium]